MGDNMFVCPTCSTEYNNNLSFCPKDGQKLVNKSGTSKLSSSPNIQNQRTARMLGASTRFEMKEELDIFSIPMKYKVFDLELDCEAYALVYPKRAANHMNVEKAKKINRISHINLVKPIAFTETQDGDIQAIYELVNGTALDQLLKKRELPELIVIKIGRQLASCLSAFHKQNLLHTNLHPGNVMMVSEQDNADVGQVKVLNLLSSWNSEIRDAIEKNTDITATLQTKIMRDYRKIRYQRPDPGEVGPQGDVYAIGMILAEMMLGKAFPAKQLDLPYEYMNKAQIIDESLSNITHRLPVGFREMISKCLDIDVTKTYQNANELLNELIAMERSTSLYVTNPINSSNSQQPLNRSTTGDFENNSTEKNEKISFFKTLPRSLIVVLPLVILLGYCGINAASYLSKESTVQTPLPLSTSSPSPLPSLPQQTPYINSTTCSEKSTIKIQEWYSEGIKAIEKGIVLEPPENSAKSYYDNISQECPFHPFRQSLEDEMVLYYLRKGDLAQSKGNKDYACFWYNRGSIINKNNDLVREKMKLCQ
jgi:serine/threonine protein kinase